ncbi:MAG: DUF2188 domain-containing protein [Gemmatimonadota bacterium]|nr:DUF2188 domain-containing protein [Gemmatimonadota bacterium]
MLQHPNSKGPNVWVVRHGDHFSVKEAGHRKRLLPPVSQRVAIKVARALAKANGSELIVQDRHGRIRLRDSQGADPFPPRG